MEDLKLSESEKEILDAYYEIYHPESSDEKKSLYSAIKYKIKLYKKSKSIKPNTDVVIDDMMMQ